MAARLIQLNGLTIRLEKVEEYIKKSGRRIRTWRKFVKGYSNRLKTWITVCLGIPKMVELKRLLKKIENNTTWQTRILLDSWLHGKTVHKTVYKAIALAS